MPKQHFRDSMNYFVAFLTCFVNDLDEREEVPGKTGGLASKRGVF